MYSFSRNVTFVTSIHELTSFQSSLQDDALLSTGMQLYKACRAGDGKCADLKYTKSNGLQASSLCRQILSTRPNVAPGNATLI
jgi:hypothetical protein